MLNIMIYFFGTNHKQPISIYIASIKATEPLNKTEYTKKN